MRQAHDWNPEGSRGTGAALVKNSDAGSATPALSGSTPVGTTSHDPSVPSSTSNTTECGGCSSKEPCDHCADAEAHSPARQALDWALTQVNGTLDPFWSSALVAEMVRSAPERSNNESWAEVDAFLDNVHDFSVVARQGGQASYSVVSLDSLPVSRPSRFDLRPEPPPGEGTDQVWCCPLAFHYPRSWDHRCDESAVKRAYNFAFWFDVLAVFKEGGPPEETPSSYANVSGGGGGGETNPDPTTDPGSSVCRCECCRFIQLIVFNEMSRGRATSSNSYVEPPQAHDNKPKVDCSCANSRDKWGCDGRDPGDKSASCLGDGDDSREEGNGGDVFAAWKGYSDSGCQYWTSDEPFYLWEHPRDAVRSWKWDWVSIGLIVDQCHNWAIKRMCILKYTDWGVHAPDGRVYHGTGAPKITRDCSMKNWLALFGAQVMVSQFRNTRRQQGRDKLHGPGSPW
jgi:hypothetical protein